LDLGKVADPYPFVPPFEVGLDVGGVDLASLRATILIADTLSNCENWVRNATRVPADRIRLECESQGQEVEGKAKALDGETRQAIVLVGVPGDEGKGGLSGGAVAAIVIVVLIVVAVVAVLVFLFVLRPRWQDIPSV
jgi:hypothetical protein